ncbi:hypothetical protein SAY87_006760 [Trapa incisa]|uniref:Uncharacterized protein n=1 Tax=Trapa incisa TaxID=236973 RepID=A0AAN7PZQ3_9MYRT|nr:hypothetical protein SAY87_006760 [Trapa incisa]
MGDSGSTGDVKLMGTRQIVRLKEIIQKWQAVTFIPKTANDGSHKLKQGQASANARTGNPLILSRRLEQLGSCSCDSDEERSHNSPSGALPPDVPKGYLAVYVSEELRRFVIPTGYLRHSLFKVMLEKAEEEYGFDHRGGLTIPCEIETFKYIIKCIENQTRDKERSAENSESAADKSAG